MYVPKFVQILVIFEKLFSQHKTKVNLGNTLHGDNNRFDHPQAIVDNFATAYSFWLSFQSQQVNLNRTGLANEKRNYEKTNQHDENQRQNKFSLILIFN